MDYAELLGLRRPKRHRRWRLIIPLALLAVIAVLAPATLGWRWSGSERTELAQWVMASASVVTLVAALAAAVYAAGAFHLESEREERWNDSQRRQQASLVAAWTAGYENDEEGRVLGADVVLRNASNLPVTSVSVRLRVELWSPGRSDVVYSGDWVDVGLLPPSEHGDHSVQWVQVEPGNLPATGVRTLSLEHPDATFKPDVYAELTFRDAGGSLWRRDGLGYLVELERSVRDDLLLFADWPEA
jgi:hypothetical protein